MDVFIDSEPFPTTAATLGHMIDDARQQVTRSGRLIVEVRLDGRAIDDQELDRLAPTTLQGVEDLQLVTADPLELSIAILHGVGAALHEARDAQHRAADAFAADDTPAALAHVKTALTVWQQAQQTVQQTAQLHQLPLDQVTVNGQAVPQIINDLAEKLQRVRQQLLASDWVGLSDSMAYELDASAQTWSHMLQVFREKIETLRSR